MGASLSVGEPRSLQLTVTWEEVMRRPSLLQSTVSAEERFVVLTFYDVYIDTI